MRVIKMRVTCGGGGYLASPTVGFVTGPGKFGRDAGATAQVSGGRVVSIDVDCGGDFYQEPPTVTITGGGGQGAAATAEVGNKIPSTKETHHAEHRDDASTFRRPLPEGQRPRPTASEAGPSTFQRGEP